MSLLMIAVSIGICLVLAYVFIFSKPEKQEDGPAQATVTATNLKKAHISITSPGGFDKLCVKDLGYGTIGANMTLSKFKDRKFILSNEASLSDIKELESINNGMECLILVEIHAIGINYADCCIRWGLYESAKQYVGYPITPGFEFSGKVTKIIGKQTSKSLIKFKIGDPVYGVSLFGAYSTHILVPNHQLWHKPKNIDMSEAAGLLCTLFTAYYGLFTLAMPTALPHIQESVNRKTATFFENITNSGATETELKEALSRPATCVLIHSASGGVGSMLVQLCKKIAKFEVVVGVVGGQHKIAIAKAMGCDFVIDRKDIKNLKNGNIWDEMDEQISIRDKYGGFDIVFDANGVATLNKSYQYLKPTGVIVTYGFHTMLPHTGVISPLQWLKVGYNLLMTPRFNPMKLVTENKGVLGFNLSFLFSRSDVLQDVMANVTPWIENGDIRVAKVTTYKLEDVANAHKDLQSGTTVGKLVLTTQNAS